MSDDDDLPVLTQVLRTGRPGAIDPATPVAVRTPDALDPRTVPEGPWLADQLVIGHAPAHVIESYLGPSFDVPPATAADDVAQTDEARHAQPADVFVLSQDHDAPQVIGVSFDEPEFRTEPVVAASPEDPAVFAERVRDAVLDSLAARIDTELDARVAQAIHVEVETALGQLQARLRTAFADALKDVVQRAVDEEIARLAAQRSGDGA